MEVLIPAEKIKFYSIIFLAVAALFLVVGSSDPHLLTGFSIKNIAGAFTEKQDFEVGLYDFYLDYESNNYYSVVKQQSGKSYVARFYPKIDMWKEAGLYVKNSKLLSDENKDISIEVLKIDRDFLPKDPNEKGYFKFLDHKGEEQLRII